MAKNKPHGDHPLTETEKRLLIQLRQAEIDKKAAEVAYDALKAECVAYWQATGFDKWEDDISKLSIYESGGDTYLNPKKVKELLTQEQFEACLSVKNKGVAVRITPKKV